MTKITMVDLVRRSWNTLEAVIREGSEALRGLPFAEKAASAV